MLAPRQQPRPSRPLPRPPSAVYLRETAVLDALTRFYTQRVFGPHRHAALAAHIAGLDTHAAREREHERGRLQRHLADLTRRQDAVLRQAQNGDPDDPFAHALRGSYNDLEAEKTATLAPAAALDTADQNEPTHPGDPALLDHLPYLTLNLAAAPPELLRVLFEATRLTIAMHPDGDDITITVTCPATTWPASTMPPTNSPPRPPPTGSRRRRKV